MLAWWSLLAWSTQVRHAFEPDGDRRVLDAYLLPDLVVLAAGSLVAAWCLLRAPRRASAAVGAVLGGFAYATLHLLGWTVRTGRAGQGWPRWPSPRS